MPVTWAAHESYIASHSVNDLLSDALSAMLQAQPHDPASFLASHFAGQEQRRAGAGLEATRAMLASVVPTPRSSYFQRKQPQIETLMQGAVDDMIDQQADDPEAFLSEWLQQRRAAPSAPASIEVAARLAHAEAATVIGATARPAHAEASGASDEWSVSSWLGARMATPVQAALLRPLGESVPADVALAFMRKVGSDRAAVRSLLGTSLLDDLADVVCAAASELTSVETSAEALSKKFSETTFTLTFGGLDTFSAGLEGQIGPPNPNLHAAMAREHCESVDSSTKFTTTNYGLHTTSETEWWYVTDPHRGLQELQLTAWPSESLSEIDACHARGRVAPRGRPLADFLPALARVNGELEALSEPELLEEELIGGRLYTGPMYQKYNLVLRSAVDGAPPFMRAEFQSTCGGNTYTTTLHVLNSCIVKLSKLTTVKKVYRGLAKGVLPAEFWAADKYGIRGGVEAAFMSTTADRAVASAYAAGGGAGLLLELEQGMCDRGAELAWLSQYPHEVEVLFAPLTGIELKGTRVEGSVVVAEMALAVNLMAPTIEKVVAKMQRSHMQLLALLSDKLRYAGAPAAVLTPIHELHRQAADSAPSIFNDPTHFKNCTLRALECTHAAVSELALRSTWVDDAEEAEGEGEGGGGERADNDSDNGALVRKMRTMAIELEQMGEFTVCSRVLELALELSPLDAATLPAIADGTSAAADAVRGRVHDLTRLAEMRWRYRVANQAVLEEDEASRATTAAADPPPPPPPPPDAGHLLLRETEALLGEALRLLDRLPCKAQGAHPRSAGYRGRAAQGLATALMIFGPKDGSRLNEAEALLDVAQRFAITADDVALQGSVLNGLGSLAQRRSGGSVEGLHAAERHFLESIKVREQLPEGGEQGAFKAKELAQSHVSLGSVYRELLRTTATSESVAAAATDDSKGFHAKAVHHFGCSGRLYSLGYHEGHIKVVNAYEGLLKLHEQATHLEEAISCLDSIIDTLQQLNQKDHSHHDLEKYREHRKALQGRLDATNAADSSSRGSGTGGLALEGASRSGSRKQHW